MVNMNYVLTSQRDFYIHQGAIIEPTPKVLEQLWLDGKKDRILYLVDFMGRIHRMNPTADMTAFSSGEEGLVYDGHGINVASAMALLERGVASARRYGYSGLAGIVHYSHESEITRVARELDIKLQRVVDTIVRHPVQVVGRIG